MLFYMRFATIGSNFIVDSFLRGALHDERFCYTALYSRTAERGNQFASKYSKFDLKIFTSLEELAKSSDIDAVYIASPNICHSAQAIMMMEHGKHVLCEKPLSTNYEEGLRMVEAARRNGVALMEAMKTTLLPNFTAVRNALPKIGKVRRFTAQFCQYSSRYDAFKGGEVLNAFNPELGGGGVLDLGVYGVAPMIHLFGEPTSRVALSRLFLHNGMDAQGTLLFSYPEMEAVISYSKISDSTMPTEIQGEQGRIIIKKLSQMTEPYIIYRDGSIEDISLPTIEENMYYELKEFIDIIESGKMESEENTHDRSLAVLKLIAP